MTTSIKTHRSTRDELIEGLLKAELVGPQISPTFLLTAFTEKVFQISNHWISMGL